MSDNFSRHHAPGPPGTRAQRRVNRETMLYRGMATALPWLERTRKWSTAGGKQTPQESCQALFDQASELAEKRAEETGAALVQVPILWNRANRFRARGVIRARKPRRAKWPRRHQVNARGRELR